MNVSDWKPVINKGFCITITNTIIHHYTPTVSTPLTITMSGGRQKYTPTEWQASFSEDEVREKCGGTGQHTTMAAHRPQTARNSKSCNRVRPAQYSFRLHMFFYLLSTFCYRVSPAQYSFRQKMFFYLLSTFCCILV